MRRFHFKHTGRACRLSWMAQRSRCCRLRRDRFHGRAGANTKAGGLPSRYLIGICRFVCRTARGGFAEQGLVEVIEATGGARMSRRSSSGDAWGVDGASIPMRLAAKEPPTRIVGVCNVVNRANACTW